MGRGVEERRKKGEGGEEEGRGGNIRNGPEIGEVSWTLEVDVGGSTIAPQGVPF